MSHHTPQTDTADDSRPSADAARIPAHDESLDGKGTGPGAGVWASLLVGLLVLIVLLIFILQNMSDVTMHFLPWTTSLPLGVAMLLAAIAGGLLMGLVGSIRLFSVNRRMRRLEKDRERLLSSRG